MFVSFYDGSDSGSRGMSMKTSRPAKRSGAKREGARSESSAFRVERFSGARRAAIARQNAEERAITLWKGVIANRKVRDLNLHLQGLYAELGKAVFEALSAKGRSGVQRFSGRDELVARIADMRKQTARLAAEERTPLVADRRKKRI